MAKILYVRNGYTQAQIADLVEVSMATVNRWAKQQDWRKLKATQTISREQTLNRLYENVNELQMAINERPKGKRYANNRETDIIIKLTSAIEKLESEIPMHTVIKVFTDVSSWLYKQDRHKGRAFVELADLYVQKCLNTEIETG